MKTSEHVASSTVITLTQYGEHIKVCPAPVSLQQRLAEKQCLAGALLEGGQIIDHHCRPRHPQLVSPRGEDHALVYAAGLEAAIRRAAIDEGYRVHLADAPETFVEDTPETILEAPRQVYKGTKPRDDLLLDCARKQNRALIRYRRGDVDRAWLIAQLALAWPRLRLVCLVHNCEEGRSLRHHIQHYLPREQVRFFNSKNGPEVDCRVALSTPMYLRHWSVKITHRHIVVVSDALRGLGEKACEEMDGARDARFYGLISDQAKISGLEETQLRERFGFEEISIPLHGHSVRGVEVTWHRIEGGRRIEHDASMVTLKRLGLWQNATRNRRIARLARVLREGDHQTITKDYPTITSELPHSGKQRLLIVVENVEHALQLAKQLKGWPVFCGENVCRVGMSKADRMLLHTRTMSSKELRGKGIITSSNLEKCDLDRMDVLLRADCGTSLPPLGKKALICPQERTAHPLLLIDTNDRHHPMLRKWTAKRRSAYRQTGWYAQGANAVEERVGDFLAA